MSNEGLNSIREYCLLVTQNMNGKNMLEGHFGPVTQSIASIKALLSWKGRASDPLPSFVELGKDDNRVVLVLSNKRDAYYCVTSKKCSCPAATYHQGPCKHQRKHFGAASAAACRAGTSEPLIKRGGFRPIDTLPSEERRAASEAA